MIRLLMKLIPVRARSMDEFINLVRQEGCRTVQILPVERNLGMPGTAGCSMFIWVPSTHEYIGVERYLLYSARTATGRVIKYIGDRVAEYEETGFFGKVAREKGSFELFFKEERGARHLRTRLPGVVVEELDFLGALMTQMTRRDICRQAAECGITHPAEHA